MSGLAATFTHITVTGDHFFEFDHVYCRFNNSIRVGTFVSSTEVTCTSPAYGVGVATVQISNNMIDWSQELITYTYTTGAEGFYVLDNVYVICHSVCMCVVGSTTV